MANPIKSTTHSYIESQAAVKNLYNPVEYMLKRRFRQGAGAIVNAMNNGDDKEGGKLYRRGVFLVHVEGDAYYHHFLHYHPDNRLHTYTLLHRKTGKVEQWTLIYDGVMLDRYNYEVLHDAVNNIEDSPNAPYEGYGQEIDGYLS